MTNPEQERTTSTGYLLLALVIAGKLEVKEATMAAKALYQLGKLKKLQKKQYLKNFLNKQGKKSRFKEIEHLFED